MRRRNALERRISRMVKFLSEKDKNESETGPSIIFDSHQFVLLRMLWTCLIFLSTCTLIYQTYDRLNDYMQYPVEVDVQIETMPAVTFPKFTICSEDTEAMKEFLENASIKITNCLFTMYNIFSYDDLNLTTLWDATNAAKAITRMEFSNSPVKPRQDKLISPYGTCTTYYSDEAFAYQGENTAFNIDIVKPQGTCTMGVIRLAFHPDDEPMDYQCALGLTPGYKRKMGLDITKYKFVNRPKSPCQQQKADFFKCMERCREKLYKERLCRYPFIPAEIDLPTCKSSLSLQGDFYSSFSVYMGFTANPMTCKCIRACEQILYDVVVTPEEITGNISHFSFFYRSNYVTITTERLAYDITALCADTGGNLGLCLGWSGLDIIYWITYLHGFKKKGKKNISNFHENDPIFTIVQRTFQQTTQVKQKKHAPSIIMFFGRHAFTFLCFMFASYLAFTRIAYYFSYPTKTALTIHNDDIVQYPIITVCLKNKIVINRLNYAARKKKLPNSCNLTLIDLMDPVLKFPVDKIWEWSKIQGDDLESFSVMANRTSSNINLPFGNCLSYTTGPVPQANTYYDYFLGRYNLPVSQGECLQYFPVIITVPHEVINPTLYELIPDRTLASFRYTMKVVHLTEESTNPNVTMEFKACKSTCIMNKIMDRITCKMPYIQADHLPTCNSTDAARRTETIFVEAFITVRPVEHCGCSKSSKYIIYDYRTNIDSKDVGISLMIFFFGNTQVEHYSKVTSYTMSKLISEVGSDLSAVLGLSVISLLQLLHKMYRLIFNILNKGKCLFYGKI